MLASSEQHERLHHRYHLAGSLSAGARVLELGCGSGLGLEYLNVHADAVVGSDVSESLLNAARKVTGVPLVSCDAAQLPFKPHSFELVVCLEALYYFPELEAFVREARQVLCSGGCLLLGTINPDWSGFSPSRLSTRYWKAGELVALLRSHGFDRFDLYAAFPAEPLSTKERAVSALRRWAARFHLIPRTLGGRAFLKRLAYGPQRPLEPVKSQTMSPMVHRTVTLEETEVGSHKIFYVVAH